MASSKSYLEFVLEQLSGAEGISSRAMMGEYVLYCQGKIIGGVYDDRFLVKPTPSARRMLPDAPMELPYEGAKEMLLVDRIEDRDFLRELIEAMLPQLPVPKQRKCGNQEKKTNGKGNKAMIKVYCYNKCSTCKKALQWLDARGVAYTPVDIKAEHPDEAALREYHAMSGLPLKRLFNTSGIQYREQALSQKLLSMPEDEQFRLLASDGMLVKRPLLVGDGFVLVGFKEAEWEERL